MSTAANRPFNSAFWQDRYIRDLNQNTKMVYLFLITSHRLTLSGIYEISPTEIARHALCDMTRTDDVFDAIDTLVNDGKILYDDGWVFLVNRLKHQSLNPNMEKGLFRELSDLEGQVPKAFDKRLQSLTKGFPKGIGNPIGKLIPILKPILIPKGISSSADDGAFKLFWNEYPKKTHKADAIKAWGKNADNLASITEKILVFIKEAKKTEAWKDPQFIPNPAAFLNGRRWEDDLKSYGSLKTRHERIS